MFSLYGCQTPAQHWIKILPPWVQEFYPALGLGSGGRLLRHCQTPILRERPPELIQHVLTVLVFWSWVLLRPRLPPRSLKLFPWPSILLHGPLDICLDLLPAAPRPPMQKRDAQHMFLQHRGARAEILHWIHVSLR